MFSLDKETLPVSSMKDLILYAQLTIDLKSNFHSRRQLSKDMVAQKGLRKLLHNELTCPTVAYPLSLWLDGRMTAETIRHDLPMTSLALNLTTLYTISTRL